MTPTASQDPPIPQGGGGLMLWPWPWQGGWGGDPEPGTFIYLYHALIQRGTPQLQILKDENIWLGEMGVESYGNKMLVHAGTTMAISGNKWL